MKHAIYIVLLVLFPTLLWGQSSGDSIYHYADTTQTIPQRMYYFDISNKPDANRAVWLGAICPGLGQIYNRSYWKLPIVYGGFMGCTYAIIRTNNKYTDYKQAYRDILSDVQLSTDPTRSYNALLPEGYDIDRMGGRQSYTQHLQKNQNEYRRYRDISVVATILVYALSLVDAYVDAQLFDYDISPDLSLQLEPQIYHDLQNQRSAELKLAITF